MSDKDRILQRLEMIRQFVQNSESAKTLAVISYKKHQEDLHKAMEELDELEAEIKQMKSRSFFDLMFGDPIKQLDEMFNKQVHEAIEECEGESNISD